MSVFPQLSNALFDNDPIFEIITSTVACTSNGNLIWSKQHALPNNITLELVSESDGHIFRRINYFPFLAAMILSYHNYRGRQRMDRRKNKSKHSLVFPSILLIMMNLLALLNDLVIP